MFTSESELKLVGNPLALILILKDTNDSFHLYTSYISHLKVFWLFLLILRSQVSSANTVPIKTDSETLLRTASS